MTPQVFENDVSNQICDASSVALVVVDEAHKAVGQHSIVKALKYVGESQKSAQNVLAILRRMAGTLPHCTASTRPQCQCLLG
jgi:ERCC4-related helicase